MKSNLIFLSTFLLIFISCAKDGHEVTVPTTSTFEPTIVTTSESNAELEGCTPANTNNPIDSVGAVHNYLVGLIENLCYPTDNATRVLVVTDSMLNLRYGSTMLGISGLDISETEDLIDEIDDDLLEDYLDNLGLDQLYDKLKHLRHEEMYIIDKSHSMWNGSAFCVF